MSGGITAINEYAFYGCAALDTCVLPNSITHIGASAFGRCTKLSSFSLPTEITEIGENAFSISGITTFTNTEDSKISVLTRLSFNDCNNIESFTIPDSVTIINENAISSCENLKTIEFGSNIYRIDDYAFSNCPLLEKIVIGDNNYLQSFTYLVFNDCPKLFEIDATGENHFLFDDCILYNRAQTEIIIFLRATNPSAVIIPSTVRRVTNFALSDCSCLKNVTFLGSGLKRIEMSAFQNCVRLQEVNFPCSLEFIGTSAFKNCDLRIINILESNITSLNDGCFSNNRRLSLIILPTVLEQCSSTSFTGTSKRALVFYHGSTHILNSAGFLGTVQVFCFEKYTNNRFLGLPVQRSFNHVCTSNRKQELIISKSILSLFIAVIYS
jgi:hypothetical protein